jgi:hypothetical protein
MTDQLPTRGRTVDDLIDRWLSRIPQAAKAYHQDAYYHAQMVWMRRMLTTMDMAMEDEGVPEVIRQRVVRVVIFGGPDEVAALARMEKAEHPLVTVKGASNLIDDKARRDELRAGLHPDDWYGNYLLDLEGIPDMMVGGVHLSREQRIEAASARVGANNPAHPSLKDICVGSWSHIETT